VVGEEDRPLVDAFLKSAHESDMPQSMVTKALGWYYSQQEQAMQEVAARDQEFTSECQTSLRAEWGAELQLNNKIAMDVLNTAGEDYRDTILTARGPDGRRLGDSPQFVRWLASLGREINPVATLVPGSGTNAMQSLMDEKASMEKLMGDHDSEYWKGPKAEGMQARYRAIIEAEEKAKKRAA
jgi:hypothetical protein